MPYLLKYVVNRTFRTFVMLYCHLLIHAEIYIYILDTYRRNDKDSGRLLYKIFTSHFIARVRKGLLRVCAWEGAGDRTETAICWPLSFWPSTLCLSRSPDAQPEVQRRTLLGDGFLYCILSASSLDPNSPGLLEGPFGRVWLSLPHLVYNCLQLYCNWTSNSTELYNSSTPTWSPTRSLKSHV